MKYKNISYFWQKHEDIDNRLYANFTELKKKSTERVTYLSNSNQNVVQTATVIKQITLFALMTYLSQIFCTDFSFTLSLFEFHTKLKGYLKDINILFYKLFMQLINFFLKARLQCHKFSKCLVTKIYTETTWLLGLILFGKNMPEMHDTFIHLMKR